MSGSPPSPPPSNFHLEVLITGRNVLLLYRSGVWTSPITPKRSLCPPSTRAILPLCCVSCECQMCFHRNFAKYALRISSRGRGFEAVLWLRVSPARLRPPDRRLFKHTQTERRTDSGHLRRLLGLRLLQLPGKREGCCGRCFLIKAPIFKGI